MLKSLYLSFPLPQGLLIIRNFVKLAGIQDRRKIIDEFKMGLVESFSLELNAFEPRHIFLYTLEGIF